MSEIYVCFGLLALLLGIGLGAVIIYYMTRYPGDSLGAKFKAMGDLRGLTVQDIINIVGDPSQRYDRGGGQVVFAWSAGGYYISLIFQDGKCTGVDEEISI